MGKAEAVEKQVAVEAEAKMLSGKKDLTQNLGEGDRHKRESVTKAADSIGVSAQTYRDMKLVAGGFLVKSWSEQIPQEGGDDT